MTKWAFLAVLIGAAPAFAQQRPPLLSEPVVDALAKELSGERAHETIKAISANHRIRGSRPFRLAADFIIARAREGGLDSARVEEFPADGKIFYGTQRSRPPWDAEFAELWEVKRNERVLLTTWAKQPMSVAQDSESGDVTAELVDVGAGSSEKDYAGKNVRGKLILISSQPEAAVPLGIAKYGAAGIISYAQNQRTGWWGENTELVRWGHLDTFSPAKTFAFMVSPAMAKSFKDRLARSERVTLHARVKAGQHAGAYSIATAMIRGADPRLSQEEIVFSCHLDHPNPGANDNASGCATILEVGVTLAKLIKDGKIPRPARTIRFVWPPEIEGTMVVLNAKPEWAKRIKAVVHMDMVGGGPETKAVFHVSAGPGSLPSFVYAVGQRFGAWVNEQTYQFAATGQSKYSFVSPKGGKEPLLAALDQYDMGSDHDVYQEASWAIPTIYLHDWPDRYIHTTWDTPDKIDPTKLLRAAFIGAASGYFLAAPSSRVGDLSQLLRQRAPLASTDEIGDRFGWQQYATDYGLAAMGSVYDFDAPAGSSATVSRKWEQMMRMPASGDSALLFVRSPSVKGPMSVFGYNYLTDKLGAERVSKLRLLQYQGIRGAGDDYAYEVLNLVNGSLLAIHIRHIVSAIYGPVPFDIVLEYLNALKEAGVVTSR